MKKGPPRTILPGLRLGHVVEEQDVEVRVGSQDSAYALLERVGEMNRSRFLPAIGRVFDEFDRPNEIIRIDRLDLDLGTLAEGELGRAEDRLIAALREALRKAMPPPGSEPGESESADRSPAHARGVADAMADAFLHFLLRGAWPYGSALDLATEPADLLDRLIEDQPAALVAMLRRHGRSETAVQRLVRQIPTEALERLLGLLEPADSAWILIYMEETKASHEEEPLVDEEPDAFERLLWTIVLRDSLNRAGLRANRRTFLRNLIARIAEAGSFSYAELLKQLRRNLAALPGIRPGADSLLSIIRELGAEEGRSEPPPRPSFADLVHWLQKGEVADGGGRRIATMAPRPGPGARHQAADALFGIENASFAELFRDYPAETRWLLARLIRQDGETLLIRLKNIIAAEDVARLLLPAGQATQMASELRTARGPNAKAALLRAALNGSAKDRRSGLAGEATETPSGAQPGWAKRTVEGRTGGMSPGGKSGRPDEAELSPLAWVELILGAGPDGDGSEWSAALSRAIASAGGDRSEWNAAPSRAIASPDGGRSEGSATLSRAIASPDGDRSEGSATLSRAIASPDGDRSEWSDTLSRAIASAAQVDPIGLRRMMRRFAAADPRAFVERVGGPAGTGAAFQQLVAAPCAETLASLAGIASCTDAETAGLVHLAASSSVSAGAETLVQAAISLIARGRGEKAEWSRRTLLARARRAGGAAGRRLAHLLEAAAEPPIRPHDPESRRAAALDALRGMLTAPGTKPVVVAPSAALLSSLSGMSASALRACLGRPSLRLEAAAASLGQLDDSASIRLILLLAPRRAEAKSALRKRLAGSRRRTARAEILAELLVTGTIGPERDAPPPARPRSADGPAGLRLIERAVRKGGGALGAPEVRAALARLLAERPFELIRLLAAPGAAPGAGQSALRDAFASSGDLGAALSLLRDPLALAAAFGGLPPSEHDLAASLASLIAGPGGRSAIATEKAASALALATAALLARPGGTGLAARWLGEMMRSASLSEQARLRRLIRSHWPDDKRDLEALTALGLKPAGGGAAPKPDRGPVRLQRDKAPEARLPEKGSIAWLTQLLRDRPRDHARLLRTLLRDPRAREAACRFLPETLLVQLLAAIAPFEARSLLSAAELTAKALEASGGGATRAAVWNAVLAVAARGGGIESLLEYLAAGRDLPGLSPPSDGFPALWTRLAALARMRGHWQLRTALDELQYDRRRSTAPRPPTRTEDRDPDLERESRVERKLWDKAAEEDGLRIAISNAGLVLAAPFLPTFFERLGLLDDGPEGKKWRSQDARDRGIHLLQYLVESRCDRPEPFLALNKLLCGQPLGFPVSASIEPTDEELATCDSLLKAILANWPMLRDSSVAALRETFLQREGCIVRIEAGWRVDVERKVLDVLVDSIPWGFSMIFHPWMDEPVSVAW